MSEQIINDNEFNAEFKRRNSEEKFDQDAKPKRSSFKNSDSYVRTHSGTFVRMDSDNFTRNLSGGQQLSPDQSRSGTNGMTGTTGMPDFRGTFNQSLGKISLKILNKNFHVIDFTSFWLGN